MIPQFESPVARDVWQILSQIQGKMFFIYFTKRDGTPRSLECVFREQKHLAQRPKFDPLAKNLIYTESYTSPRWIPADTVSRIVCEGRVFTTGYQPCEVVLSSAERQRRIREIKSLFSSEAPAPPQEELPLHDYRVSFFNGTFQGSLTVSAISEAAARQVGGQIARLTRHEITRIGVKHLGLKSERGIASVRKTGRGKWQEFNENLVAFSATS